MSLRRALSASVRRLGGDERGVISAFNLFLTVACCAVGAAAVDVTHFYAAQTQLQVGADLAAHAALYTRRYGRYEGGTYYALTDDQAKTAAVDAVQHGMPTQVYGTVVAGADIVLGRLNFETGQVIADAANPEAAQVLTHRAGANPVGSFLFRIVGIDSMNVNTSAVFSLGPGECRMDQGFFSQTQVAINGGNTFYPGFCIGTPKFWVRNQNSFRPGMTTLIPNGSGLDLSGSDVDKHNPGLMQSVQYGALDLATTLNLVNNDNHSLNTNLQHFQSHDYARWLLTQPDWTQVVTDLTRTNPITVTSNKATFRPGDLATNTVHVIRCPSDKSSIVLRDSSSADTFRNIVILTNCPVSFDGDVKLEDMVLSSTYIDKNSASITAPSSRNGLTIGKNDNCAPGGGAALITRGRFDAAAKVNFYGAQIRAGTEVDFQSNATGQGVSIIAGDRVRTNSNAEMQVCGPTRGRCRGTCPSGSSGSERHPFPCRGGAPGTLTTT
ncbi:hypothetical protein Rumeso_02868 [Rubellimicrobium mesophilum DSM 19309]|uniref:Flp pilus-assembly TadG-like N-terminal domain-containing protein n=2 Tax=Rubellimicrobium TaxID=295418 RepID=A0A017HM18_9RHOB|nr:hypothetical protein Rumeso_02868 [Rubellimicrobium mesophilum DSM 19309]